jgi:hypothetical protein
VALIELANRINEAIDTFCPVDPADTHQHDRPGLKPELTSHFGLVDATPPVVQLNLFVHVERVAYYCDSVRLDSVCEQTRSPAIGID